MLFVASFTATVRAADDDNKDADEYEETARVARVSMLRGDVQLKRSGSKSWEIARQNFPLVEGDLLATTGQDARLEIQIDARNFVRVGGDSMIRIVTLRDEGVALSLSEGIATIRLARFDKSKEYFEVDAPGTTLAAEKLGVYRLDVEREGRVRLTVRDGGQARIYSETSGFTLRDGRVAELVSNGTDAGDWELSQASPFDAWDAWVDERERFLASNLHYDNRDRYYDSDVWGAEDLDAYGDWVYANEYDGWVWRPRVAAINNYDNWAPYRYGRWVWCPPYGWTWVGDEPWGWAPYHYGRWVYYNDSWCWAPRGYGYNYHRAWWRPALVVFVYVPTTYGERVCWYPLGYGQRDPRGRHYQRLEALRSDDVARLRRTNPAYLRAITTIPARDFGRQSTQGQLAPTEIARRAITAEPVRGRLPIAPVEGSTNGDGRERREARNAPARPPSSTTPTPTLRDRPTGAATRTPGVPLDGELRRTRLYQGREPRPDSTNGGNIIRPGGNVFGNTNPASTGAVTRPPRTRSQDRPAIERSTESNDGTPSTGGFGRSGRPARANPDEERTPVQTTSPTIGQPPSRPAPARREERPQPRPVEEPQPTPELPRLKPQLEAKPEPRPEPREERRPEPRSEPRPEPRPEPKEERRPEPRPVTREEPRPEPRQESRPEPKQESRPEPRPEPQRQESKPAERQRDPDTARPPRKGDGR